MAAPPRYSDEVPDWTRAKCGDVRVDDHFPERGTAQKQAGYAKDVCNGKDGRPICPILQPCLDYAIATNEHFGVWGGMSERQRHNERRRRKEEAERLVIEEQAAQERRRQAARKGWDTRRSKTRGDQAKRGKARSPRS